MNPLNRFDKQVGKIHRRKRAIKKHRESEEPSCPSGKKGYRSEMHAQRHIEHGVTIHIPGAGSFASGKQPIRAYLCPRCGKYHTTSWESYQEFDR